MNAQEMINRALEIASTKLTKETISEGKTIESELKKVLSKSNFNQFERLVMKAYFNA